MQVEFAEVASLARWTDDRPDPDMRQLDSEPKDNRLWYYQTTNRLTGTVEQLAASKDQTRTLSDRINQGQTQDVVV
jgi:hypothetical protein